jgi:hypothetical protein
MGCNDKNQFCIYMLISLPQDNIEELVVPETRGKHPPSPLP